MIAYIENPKESSKQLLEVINEFSKVEGYKISIQKSVFYFYILVMNNSKKKLKILFTMASKRKIVDNRSVILIL